jgi:pyrroloquinoline-quinone synthase
MSPEELESALRTLLAERYHDHHPFNLRMHEGRLSPEEIRTWVRNRYYYQTRIPIKDGIILAKAESPEFRREWLHRIRDHDGDGPGDGGLELWLSLAEAVGLDRSEVERLTLVLPGVRAACDDYVKLVESSDLLTSVAASLTEMSAGEIMRERLAAFERHYPWVGEEGLRYFRSRTVQAPRDAAHGLHFVLAHARSDEDQRRCIAALERKCEILWRLLDAIEAAHARPRLAPGARLRVDPAGTGDLVVMAERAIRLSPSGREIVELCDGTRSVEAIASLLRERHPDAEAIEDDVHEFVAGLRRVRALEAA